MQNKAIFYNRQQFYYSAWEPFGFAHDRPFDYFGRLSINSLTTGGDVVRLCSPQVVRPRSPQVEKKKLMVLEV